MVSNVVVVVVVVEIVVPCVDFVVVVDVDV